ncbi:MAG: acylase [Anaerolineales bacterium]|nr:acylase [Anaerolineales bacterium]
MLKISLWKSSLILCVFLFVGGFFYLVWPATPSLAHLAQVGEKYDARILRDTWGTPHIFGKTDADAAYGLAYAHAEDDFLTTQQTLLAARGLLASVYGRDAAPNDYMVHLLRIWDVVESGYETDLSAETRAILEAYADGLNHYAALHPGEVLSADVFPVTGKDVVAGSVHKSPLFFDLDDTLAELFADEREQDVSPKIGGAALRSFPGNYQADKLFRFTDPMIEMGAGFDSLYGSNTFSIGPGRTSDGSTFLAVNSHQPWEGATTWYEAHVHSEQGWDMVGALFPGSPVIIHGHNRRLGWAFTVNHPDLADVFVLEINPDNPNQYRFDGEWLDLEVRQAAIKVRLVGRLAISVKQDVLWSVYGPVVRQPHGVYALRYAGFGKLNIWEQLYRMNKANNYAEWLAAMKDGGLPNFNVGYADADGNIYYLYNAMLPIRSENYLWWMDLPGNTSETLWSEYLPFEQLPQVLNPPSGFVQNCNSSPFWTTQAPWNPDPLAYSDTFGIETYVSNRALRALELFGSDESITFEEFVAYKFDERYSSRSQMQDIVNLIATASLPSDDPDLQAAQQIVGAWDMRMSLDSRAATLATFTMYFLWQTGEVSPSRLAGPTLEREVVLKAFEQAVGYMKEKHGRVDIPWGQVNRLIRGSLDLGLSGGPDVLHAIYGELQEDGRFKGFQGDCYVLLVHWDAQGKAASFSIHQYGSATLDLRSPHYADQALLFAESRLKPMWLDEVDIRAHLEREYRPGDK